MRSGRQEAVTASQEDSCPDYMQKAEDALRSEEERVTNYLHVDTKAKLLQEAEREILEQYETELLEKEQSGAAALMRDDKVCVSLPYSVKSGKASSSSWLLWACRALSP